MSLVDDFTHDPQGQRFADVLQDHRIDFTVVCDFFESCDRQRRMIEAEIHHNRPALSGVIRELETLPVINAFFQQHGRKNTARFRQAIGVLVRIVMAKHQWHTTGRKGSLGTPPKSSTAKARLRGRNKGGLAVWFNRAERYANT